MMEEDYDRTKVEELLEKLNSVEWGREGSVAFLVETPEPHRYVVRDRVEVVAGRGFSGDNAEKSFFKGEYVPGREVSAMAIEVLHILGVEPGVPGDNLITAGVDLGSLKTGERMRVGEVILERSKNPHRPCMTFRARTSPEAYAAASLTQHRGALFTVVRGGTIRTMEDVEILRA
ncbi:MAG: MOSC domain-containing protein [Rhodothermales bacterium]